MSSCKINPSGLLPYQVGAAESLICSLLNNQAALDGSDTGIGKTYQAGAVIRELNLPTLVVCPEIAEAGWLKMGKQLGVEFDCLNYEMVRTGRTPYGCWDNKRPARLSTSFRCTTCQLTIDETPFPCPHRRDGIHCIEAKSVPHKHGKFNWSPAIGMLVFDEVHRCAGLSSLNADMLIAAKRQGIATLALSATAANSPLQMRALGYLLGLHTLVDRVAGEGFYRWIFNLGCRRAPFGGFLFGRNDEHRKRIMADLSAKIFPRKGVRVRIADLGDAFPDSQITAELYNFKGSEKISHLYEEMEQAIGLLRSRAERDASPNHPLTRFRRAHQEIELLKVPLFVELTKLSLEQGLSVAVFVNFRQTVQVLCEKLDTDCRIEGGQSDEVRQKNISLFQNDYSRIIICNSDAGGISISLPDIRGEFPRAGLVSPGVSSTKLRQVFGRLRRQGGKSKSLYRVLFASGTIEEKFHAKLASKLNNLDALNDADLTASNLNLTSAELDVLFPE